MVTTFCLPSRIIFGSGSVSKLGAEAKGLGRRAMLITGCRSARQTGLLDRITRDLENNDIDVFIFDKVRPNPRAATVDEGAEMVRREGIDLIIGLGGGSAMDAAKCIRLASAGDKPIWDYYIGTADVKVTKPVLPLILVPTVAASGSEANNGAVITNWETYEKRVVVSPLFYSNISIVDPELTLTLPQKSTAQGGVDIFCHVVESYITVNRPSPLTDGIMEVVMKLVVEALPQALSRLDDIEARTGLSWASTMACSQFIELGGGAGYRTLHGIEHPLSGYYDIAHGDGLAALLPAWMRYTFPVRRERFDLLGRNVFGETDGIAAVERWLDKVGMRISLRNLGIETQRIEEIADCAVRTALWLSKHPNVLDAPAVAQIYRDSY
jgi:alcohol dehydrogenase